MRTQLQNAGISGYQCPFLPILFFCVSFFTFTGASAQTVPNGSFENGTGTSPADWTIMNNVHRISYLKEVMGNGTVTIGPADGQYFMQLTTDSAKKGNTMPQFGLMSINLATTLSPDSLVYNHIYYPLIADDNYVITLTYTKFDSATQKSNFAFSTSFSGSRADTTWKRESTAISYFGTNPIHDTIQITISSSNPSQHDPATQQGRWGIGATLLLDNFKLINNSATGIFETKVDFGIASSVYPNPASDKVNISFAMDKATRADLQLLDEQGRVLRTMSNLTCTSGLNNIPMDTKGLNPGIYFYRITTASKTGGGKILLN